MADGGATLQRSWVRCAAGKNATGGGFGQWDYAADVVKNVQIVTSVPATIRRGELVNTPIPGDVDQSIKPNGWLVEGFNNGATTDVSVRAVGCLRGHAGTARPRYLARGVSRHPSALGFGWRDV